MFHCSIVLYVGMVTNYSVIYLKINTIVDIEVAVNTTFMLEQYKKSAVSQFSIVKAYNLSTVYIDSFRSSWRLYKNISFNLSLYYQ